MQPLAGPVILFGLIEIINEVTAFGQVAIYIGADLTWIEWSGDRVIGWSGDGGVAAGRFWRRCEDD